jgi:hypothetical protein
MLDAIQLWFPTLVDCDWNVLIVGGALGISAGLFFASRTVEYLVFFGIALIFAMGM